MEGVVFFGVYPDISLAEARQRREQARSLLANGVDPSATKKAQKVVDTQGIEAFEVIVREWHEKFTPSWAASHAGKIISRLELYVFLWIGSKPIKHHCSGIAVCSQEN